MPKGHSYLLTDPVERNITRSDLLCASLGGYIVEVNDKQEYDFVKDFVYFKNGVIYLVIGATDEQQDVCPFETTCLYLQQERWCRGIRQQLFGDVVWYYG